MNVVENIIKNIDEDEIKDLLKTSLKQNNIELNEKCLNEMLEFIDNCQIEISEKYSFIKIPNKDEFVITAWIFIYQEGTKCPISSALQSKLRDVRTKGCYRVFHGENRIKKYWISFQHAYSFFCGKGVSYSLGSLTFDELVDYVNECRGGHYNLIYEMDENKKRVRKTLHTKDIISIYKIDFGEHGAYISQSKNVKTRISGHKNQASKGKHCYVLNELYKNDFDTFYKSLKNVQILDNATYLDYVEHDNAIRNLEYSYQV